MAKIFIENAEVTRVQRGGKGFNAQTQYKLRNGETSVQKYTVWSDDQVHAGDVLNITGNLSVKMEEFTNDKGELIRYAAIHVNQPVLESVQAGPTPIGKAFPGSVVIDTEAPF
jgi:hypothetical protein